MLHEGTAVKLTLSADLASISEEVPKGYLATDSDVDEERGIVGKAVALGAAWLAERATKAGVTLETSSLMAVLPRDVAGRAPRRLTSDTIARLKAKVDDADLDAFTQLAKGRKLQQFAIALGEACEEQGRGPLLILIDRGDNVVPTSLAAVFQLLDQSDYYTAVAAMRPGPSPPPPLVDMPASASAGDHYDVYTLGARPRSPEWRAFVEASLRAQTPLAEGLDQIPREVVNAVLNLSRDSVKVAIEVLGHAVNVAGVQSVEEAALDALTRLAENLQLSAKRVLRQFNSNVTGLLKDLRDDMSAMGAVPGEPCVLSFEAPRQSLLETTTDIDRFIAVGLRCGAFCLPEETSWAPGHAPLEVEVHPLMLWQRDDGLSVDEPTGGVRLDKTAKDVLGGGRARTPVSVFCAYRMRRPRSVEFLDALTREVRRHPALASAGIAVTNGKTDPGERWAKVIRKRIKSAKAVVADVTGMRPDVVFEIGFAYGCSTPIIPVVEDHAARDGIPFWLTDMQVAAFGEPKGLSAVTNRLIKILRDPRGARSGPPKPAPSIVVWLRPRDWNLHALDQARGVCNHEGLPLEVYDYPDDPPLAVPLRDVQDVSIEETIAKAARANLLIVNLDGGRGDDLMHFVAGAVAATPKTGDAGAARRVLVVQKPGMPENSLVADSLSRVSEVVRRTPQGHLHQEIQKFAASYAQWANKP